MTHPTPESIEEIVEEDWEKQKAITITARLENEFFKGKYSSGGLEAIEAILKEELHTLTQSVAKKAKADWLRSEIEKLEGSYLKSDPQAVAVNAHIATWEQGYNHAIDELITRYKEELKVLTGE